MSFTSPDEDIIYDHIWDYSRNDDIDNRIVMLYFEQHTSLPGPATLHVSLGSRYDNDTLYWHYYNQELPAHSPKVWMKCENTGMATKSSCAVAAAYTFSRRFHQI